MGKNKGNAGAKAARLKNNAKNPGQMKPMPKDKSVDTTLIDDPMCPSCELLHTMCTHIMEQVKKSNGLPSKETLSEFRHMCFDMAECCANPYTSDSEYSDEEKDEVFWKNKISSK